ncbi:MAG: cytidylate kinase-like family protein [Anaerovoracaceae bacterium]|nr:cytidylate kinase-like family protein [Bacillota bacterium]MDD7734289.1 cytidylate kinase-like family protein [Bacillota bacterium]MDY5906037.1 cytidylate kinase-like family protein [Anaerovoracaceae bacterium]
MIITVARQCGCEGDQIGKALAEKYGIPYYDKAAIKDMAKQKGLYEKYPGFYGEVPADTLLYTISKTEDPGSSYKVPEKALSGIVGDDDFVLLGRCGNYAFRGHENLVSIFLKGDIKKREENAAAEYHVPARKSHNLVKEMDQRRRTYHKYYTNEVWGMADNYDLCIDVTELGVQGAVEMVSTYIDLLDAQRSDR